MYVDFSQSHGEHTKLSNHSKNNEGHKVCSCALGCVMNSKYQKLWSMSQHERSLCLSWCVPWPAELQSMHRQHAKHHTPCPKPMGTATCQSAVRLKQHSMTSFTQRSVRITNACSNVKPVTLLGHVRMHRLVALEKHNLPFTYLAHHELESVRIMSTF